MQIQKIGVISNPGSTRLKNGMEPIRALLDGRPDIIHREIDAIDQMTSILGELSAQGVDLVVLNGGDGTVQAAVTSLVNDHPYPDMPALAILPGGQTNMTAEAIGTKGKPLSVLKAILNWNEREKGRFKPVSLPFVGMRLSPQDTPLYGTFFGAASVVRGIYKCRRAIHPLKLPNAITHFLAISYLVLSSLNPFKSERSAMRPEQVGVRFDEENHAPSPYFVVVVTSLDKLLLGLKATSGVGEGALRYLSVDYGAFSLLRAFRVSLFGEPRKKLVRGFVRRKVSRALVSCDSPVTLDGEMFDPAPDQPVELFASVPMKFLAIRA